MSPPTECHAVLRTTATKTRGERLYVRADSEEKARIERAAKLARENVSDFVRHAVEDRAEAVIASQHRTVLDAETFEALAAALDRPVLPNAALAKAAHRPRRFIQK
jgi:uncharacterized protein (DUF1778 family)